MAVMVVDDDADMRALLRDMLALDRLDAREEASGESLIDALEREVPDLIVMDKEMQGPSGLDLLSYIARRHRGLPVILITAFGGSAVRDEALRLGAVAYIEKPFSTDALLQQVRRLLPLGRVACAPGTRDDS